MHLPKFPNYKLPIKQDIVDNNLNWGVDPNKTILLIHDMQNYFLQNYNDNDLIKQVIQNISSLKETCKKYGVPIVYTTQPQNQSPKERGLLSDFWGPGMSSDKEQSIIEEIKPDKKDRILSKLRYSAFYETDLLKVLHLEKRDTLLISGVYGHIGCTVTACDAFMNNIKPVIVGDCIADFSRYYHLKALNYVNERCGMVKFSNEVEELMKIQISKTYNN